VWVIGDRLREGNETFSVNPTAPASAVLDSSRSRATGTIIDDDGVRRAAFAALATSAPVSVTGKRVR
jgi:hypothetical protein